MVAINGNIPSGNEVNGINLDTDNETVASTAPKKRWTADWFLNAIQSMANPMKVESNSEVSGAYLSSSDQGTIA